MAVCFFLLRWDGVEVARKALTAIVKKKRGTRTNPGTARTTRTAPRGAIAPNATSTLQSLYTLREWSRSSTGLGLETTSLIRGSDAGEAFTILRKFDRASAQFARVTAIP
jgi:hypothetical protein